MITLSRYLLVGGVLAAGVVGLGQTNSGPSCNVSSPNPPFIRSESAAELIGDILIECTGGTPTAAGGSVPAYTITLTLNTPVASRVFPYRLSEALLLVDDPYPAAPNPSLFVPPPLHSGSPQNLCLAVGPNACPIIATGDPTGNPGGDYDGASGHFNVFEGFSSGFNSVTFSGVPIDAPGPSSKLTLRLTNIRANVSQFYPPQSPYDFHQVTAFVGTVLVSGAPIVDGYPTPGLRVTQTDPAPVPGTAYSTLSVTFTEGFANAFRMWNYLEGAGPQNIPGFAYNSESGLWDSLKAPAGIPAIGVANHGTRLMLHFSGYPAGIKIIAPAAAYLQDPLSGSNTGALAYVVADANGNGPVGPKASAAKTVMITTDSQGNGWLTYEVVKSDPNTSEAATIPVLIESQAAGQASGSFGPLVASDATPIPRFVPEQE